MKSSTHIDRTFVAQQHKFRGLVSAFKSQKFVKGKPRLPFKNFSSGMRKLLLDARIALRTTQFGDFLSWVEHQTEAQLPERGRIPIGYDELSGVYISAPEAPLERELGWITERIKIAASRINNFRSRAEEIERLVFKGDFELAIEELTKIEGQYGASIWAVQLRVALEQQAGGLERQKRYSIEVRGILRRGLLAFITYNTSVRNEDKTTLAKYLEDVKVRIDKQKNYEPFIKTYLRYRLAGELPISERGIADILRVEQSHSLIDLYETFVTVVQEISRRDDFEKYRGVATKCIHALMDVKDFRLGKALLVIEGGAYVETRKNRALLDRRRSDISDALFSGRVKVAALIARRNLRLAPGIDIWQFIYAAFAFGHGSLKRVSKYGRPQDIARLLGSILSRDMSSVFSLAILTKLAVNLRGLPVSVGVIDLLQLLQKSCPNNDLRPWFIGLNSPSVGVEDLSPKGAAFGTGKSMSGAASSTPTEVAWGCFQNAASTGPGDVNLSGHLFTAAGQVRDGQYQNAVDIIRTNNIEKSPEPVRSLAVSIILHAYFAAGDRSSVIDLIADEGARSEAHRQLLPVRLTLENYQWADYKILSSPLSAPIALHLLWLENEREETVSLLRFSIREILKNPAVQRPSMLYDQADNYPVHQLVYFLSKVCVPNILDVSRVLKSTREVMGERQAICASLRFLNPANANDYQREILSINNEQAMEEGQWIVDRTRIHVDTDALKRWASKELSEAYSRYRDLLGVDVGADLDIDDLLKDVMTEAFKRMSFVPETEADALLIDILERLKEEFLNNARFGLDFYLSKRIRHQSFIGLIRGPLEFANLITTRESGTGTYHRNEWLDKFPNTGVEAKEAISKAFSKCAAKFDDTLISAKDTSFQMRSQEQPGGLVYLDLSPQLMFLVRTISRPDETLPDFMDTAVTFFWAAIEQSLAQVRRFITEDLKTTVVEAFDELRATVKKHAEDRDPTFLEFDLAIGRCSADVQRALDDAAQWFTRAADMYAVQRSFELEQVLKIAIDSALKCQRAFEPEIISEVNDGQKRMAASTLVFVNDVMFVALDNVRAHSNLKKPKVKILAEVNVEAGTFTVVVRSEMKIQNRALTEAKLKEIRDLIAAGTYGRRTRSEGGSGLLKLAADVSQSSEGRIDFGLNDAEEFQLTVVDSLILQAVSQEVSHE